MRRLVPIGALSAILSLFFALAASARTILIHAAGIDRERPQLNFPELYIGAKSFIDYCGARNLTLGRDCLLFVDPDPRSGQMPIGVAGQLGDATLGAASASRVLSAFRDALAAAAPGDQVVLSMSDHGFHTLTELSCISMDSSARNICKSDIEKALKSKKPGTKVFVVANACFSGGFAELL